MAQVDRRMLLSALGGAVATGLAASSVSAALAGGTEDGTARTPAAHERMRTRARRASARAAPVRAIDIHTHMYSRQWFDELKAAHDPNVRVEPGPHGDAMVYRWSGIGVLGPEMYDWDLRIREMDAAGVDIAVISLSAPNVYWGTRAVSAKAAHDINDNFAAAQHRYDGRIRWMASLPWDYPEDAIAELHRAHSRGAVGVCMLTNILGRPLTDERYRAIWREIEAVGLPTFVHPTLPFNNGMGFDAPALSNAIGFTSETSLCFARMMIDGFLDEFPRLRLIACHGGGALPYLAARIEQCWRHMIRDKHTKEAPTAYLRRLYFDSILYDQGSLDYLVASVGEDRVMYGSDYPFSIGDMRGILARVDALPPRQRDKVRGANAARLFDL